MLTAAARQSLRCPFRQSHTAARIRAQRPPPAPAGPRAEQSPNIAPVAIPLDTIERLVAAGLTPEALIAACREIARFVPRNDATLHATERVASAPHPKSSTERSRDFRAKKRNIHMQRGAVASVACSPSLSLVENIDLKKEREQPMQRDRVACNAASPGLMPLPDDWQPTERRRASAIALLGEATEAVMLAKFRNHYGSRPQDMRTAAGWQAKYGNWALSERRSRDGPAQLPLMRIATGPPAAPTVFIRLDSPEWEAWKRFRNGKALPIDKSGGWHVPTRWPPNHGDRPSA